MGTKKDSTIYDVAIYCRLSKEDLKEDGDRDESASIGTQKAILTDYVRQRGWHFVQTYVDLIITKSLSRFARNTVDSLTTIRKLKENKVECYFEKENIRTFDSKGELLLTIMSSLAQEESRSISENVTWGQRKRFADGKVTVPFKRFLGYDRGEETKSRRRSSGGFTGCSCRDAPHSQLQRR